MTSNIQLSKILRQWVCISLCAYLATGYGVANTFYTPSADSLVLNDTERPTVATQDTPAPKKKRFNLCPNIATLQYAGNIGVVSAGIGWDYGKQDRWETHFLVGYLPKWHAPQWDLTYTLKENFIPWHINCNPYVSCHPLVVTMFFNTVFNEEVWVKTPERYPDGYYRFSTAIRASFGLGGRFNLNIPKEKFRYSNRISVYYELSVCEMDIISSLPHKDLGLSDILNLGLGIQYRFF